MSDVVVGWGWVVTWLHQHFFFSTGTKNRRYAWPVVVVARAADGYPPFLPSLLCSETCDFFLPRSTTRRNLQRSYVEVFTVMEVFWAEVVSCRPCTSVVRNSWLSDSNYAAVLLGSVGLTGNPAAFSVTRGVKSTLGAFSNFYSTISASSV